MIVPGLVTLGETMALLAAPDVGLLRHQATMALRTGGAESNVAIGVARLGGLATWVGRVGDDELGDLVLAQLRGEGVDVGHAVRDPDAQTGLMLRTRRTEGVSRVRYYRAGSAGSRLAPEDLPLDVVGSAGVLHLTGITPALSAGAGAAVFAAVEHARAAGVPVSLDVNYRAALWSPQEAGRVLSELITAGVDLLFAGEEEAELLGAAGSAAEQAADLAALGVRDVVLKRGSRGALAHVEGTVHEVPAVPVRVVDVVGAGDAFVAGYLAEFLAGRPPQERLRTAAACGAFAVSVPGDWEGLPSRQDLQLLAAADGTVVR